jgi:hypothetical protein
MKTEQYNPSSLELDMANALVILQDQIQKHLKDNRIVKINPEVESSNPVVTFYLEDKDGDKHEIVLRIFQVPDKY